MEKRILILNGPNLNLVGLREPHIYGETGIEEYIGALREKFVDIKILYFQSNHEGVLIDLLHKYGFDIEGIILNAGAYTHSSIALRDAISAISVPVIEVHISDTKKREPFRRHSYLTDVCAATIEGKGLQGYEEAIDYLLNN